MVKILKSIGTGLLYILKSPYYLGRAIYNLSQKEQAYVKELKNKDGKKVVTEKISLIKDKKKPIVKLKLLKDSVKFEKLRVVHGYQEKFEAWQKKTFKSDSVIGIILGARGSGKTAFGIKFLENYHSKERKKCFAIGFKESEMPSWINVAENINELENNSFVLVDEGGVLFSSRKSMSNANQMLSELILVARHKNLSILFISQNSSNLEINILRQADFLILKPSSLLQRNFERKIIKNIYEDTKEGFKKYKKDPGLTYIYSDEFKGFISNPLPSFWTQKISKSFR